MKTQKYIGVMTGNSMDAIDVVLAEWKNHSIKLIASYSEPFSKNMIEHVQKIRGVISQGISMDDLQKRNDFRKMHDEYTQQVACAIIKIILNNKIEPSEIAAICTHGKTLDHCPPSKVNYDLSKAYTLQVGSGKMLADLLAKGLQVSSVRVLYDFRSADLMNGGEGAPLAPPLSALLSRKQGKLNEISYNAGNTSNLTVIINGYAVQGWDAGPCNEFIDGVVRRHTNDIYDKDGKYGKQGKLDIQLLQELFEIGRDYYEHLPPKSGDPAYYHFDRIKAFQDPENLNNVIYTTEYFAGYIAAWNLKFVNPAFQMPSEFSLYGGGWNNPIVLKTFKDLLNGKGYVLPEHKKDFQDIISRFHDQPHIYISEFQQTTEGLLWAAMGAFYDADEPWTQPGLTGCQYPTKCGREAVSDLSRTKYDDYINIAAKGWQNQPRYHTKK